MSVTRTTELRRLADGGRGRVALGVLGALVAVLAWSAVSGSSENIYFPSLLEILERTATYWPTPEGVDNLTASLRTLGAGLGLAVLVGVAAGLLIGQVPVVAQTVSPALEFVRAIPATALVPFAMMLFGVGDEMKVFLIALGCVWPILLNTADGARGLDATLLDTARVFHVTGLRRALGVVVPAVLPRVLVGVRIAVPLSLILMVTSEMVGAQRGLGYVITQAQATFQLLTMWSGIVVLGVLGFLLTTAYSALERLLLRWCDPKRVSS
ncbi:ABC transporter permease [Desertihabitans brevis]|uniref:ABC transporter permease n=1 Tax=Desertihabitans brevis TaxID=2268447 RepID=A0A367Z255_9ACTN|nr:ABC transporter permease [Desertihabitans brevis]RCK71332.1 ABC transporter permease [Desertihabitans brevis]